MRIVVDYDRCQSHGQCCFAAPELFRLDEDNQLQHADEVDESLRSTVEDAMDVCPTQSISIEG